MTVQSEKIFKKLQDQLRAKAEARLRAEGLEKPDLEDVDKIIHELHVHQIELEMQNDELRRAQLELEVARDRYIDLYDFAPVGYLTVNPVGKILECNLIAANLLGLGRKKVISRLFTEFIVQEDMEKWYRFCMKHSKDHSQHVCELTLRPYGKEALPVHIDSLWIKVGDENSTLRLSLTDITVRKQTEQALRIAAVAFEAQEGIIVTDANLSILCVNKAFSRITGFDEKDVNGKIPFFLEARLNDKRFYQTFWDTISSNGYWQNEIWDKRKEGEEFAVLLSFAEVTGEDGYVTHYVGCCTDITKQKLAEKILMNHYSLLQNQMQCTLSELEKSKLEATDMTTALNVFLKHRNSDLAEKKAALSYEAERTVLPFLNMLKKGTRDRNETRLIGILEANLKHLLESYGSSGTLMSTYQKLTPVEIQVATLVRQGMPTKVIADSLRLSSGTVSIHRKHIRKKLGLDKKSLNLYSYLISLAEQEAQ
ncbi:MAG: PAS domain S-box protein [Methylosarcina sp.]